MTIRKLRFFALTLLILIMLFVTDNHVSASRIRKTNNYYSNNTIKNTRKEYYSSKNRLEKLIIDHYNNKGNATKREIVNYDKKGKKLTVAVYNYHKKERVIVRRDYFYNTHQKESIPLKKAYARRIYDKNGKLKDTLYLTDEAQRNEIVAVAKKQVGKDYRYGGTTPKGFDCSGLTSYVYQEAINKKIGRSTQKQNKGKTIKVSSEKLKPGDLLFFGSPSNPYHVGVYIGSGKYIHSSTPSTGVIIDTLSNFKPNYAKRIL
jgi:cell wall-associated NlpC family hydrolase